MKLDDIQKLIDAATPGPWVGVLDSVQQSISFSKPIRVCLIAGNTYEDVEPDKRFIAASRELMPKLLKVARAAKVEALRWNQELCNREEHIQFENAWAELDAALAELEAE